ncbi:vegetative cell wall protein gp1-like [Miscanthus floridulus]|uniref:vegetative cell wall protein gp1-like n=1 Tax=Miscanthus floridulus TaxID=154761 RepID=UPI003457967F
MAPSSEISIRPAPLPLPFSPKPPLPAPSPPPLPAPLPRPRPHGAAPPRPRPPPRPRLPPCPRRATTAAPAAEPAPSPHSTAAAAPAAEPVPSPHSAATAAPVAEPVPSPCRTVTAAPAAEPAPSPRRRRRSLARARTAPPCPRTVAHGWRQRHAATPSTTVLALASPWSPPAASASPCLAPLHHRPRPALPPSTTSVPPTPIESDSLCGAPSTPRPPRATSVVGRATAGPDLRLDLCPASADPERMEQFHLLDPMYEETHRARLIALG